MPDAPKKRDYFGLLKQLGLIIAIIIVLLVAITAPAGAYVYYHSNYLPGSNTALLYRPGNAKCWPAGAAPYVGFFNGAATQYGVNVNLLVAIANNESSPPWNIRSHSTADAKGLMQLLPGTFEEQRDKSKSADAYDPEANIYAGTHYIAGILKNNKADPRNPTDDQIRLAVSGYNAGPGNPGGAVQSYVTAVLKDYQSYVRCSIQAGDTTGSAAITGTGAHTLANWVNQHQPEAKQSTDNNCAATVINALNQAFATGSGSSGDVLRTADASAIGQQPTANDVQQAQQILAAGDIPVWHIVGDYSGQHWIAILGISGSSVTFYDPATGTVRQDKHLTDPSNSSIGGYYFGITKLPPQNYERGYHFVNPQGGK